MLGRLNALPGVVAAGAARVTVLSGSARTVPVTVDGQPIPAGSKQCDSRARERGE